MAQGTRGERSTLAQAATTSNAPSTSTSISTRCCLCCGSGKCVRCTCATKNIRCHNCLPSRRDHCQNMVPESVSLLTDRDIASPHITSSRPTECQGSLFTSPSTSQDTSFPIVSTVPSNREDGDSRHLCVKTTCNTSFSALFDLPSFHRSSPSSDSEFRSAVQTAYEQVVHWRSNLFHPPKGNAASKFISQLSQLFNTFASASRGGDITLMSVMLLLSLILQRLYKRSKPKDHIACLEHRLPLWGTTDGVHQLLKEGKSIQRCLPCTHHDPRHDDNTTKFADLMTKGKVKDAIR